MLTTYISWWTMTQVSLVSVSDSSLIDHTLHPNSHPSSICVLSSHLLRWPKIGQAAFENVTQISVSHADCSDRRLYELLSTAPMPRIQSRWPFFTEASWKCGGLPKYCRSPQLLETRSVDSWIIFPQAVPRGSRIFLLFSRLVLVK